MDKYDRETTGEIVEVRDMGVGKNPLILAKYKVNEETYTITEEMAMIKEKTERILLVIPVGYRLKSLMESNTGVKPRPGNNVIVKYSSNNPKDAYLPENRKGFSFY